MAQQLEIYIQLWDKDVRDDDDDDYLTWKTTKVLPTFF